MSIPMFVPMTIPMTIPMAGSIFTVAGFDTPERDDPLGVWDLETSPVTSYAAGAETRGLVWRVEHPASTWAARSTLLEQCAKVDLWQQDLDVVAQRLGDLSPELSYGAYAAGTGEHEAELLAQVAALRSPVLSYGAGSGVAAAYQAIYEKADALLLQFRRLIQHYARVETASGGVSVALTTVDWTGDYETAWLEGTTALNMTLHLEAVRLALASRHSLLRLISVVTSGALELAVKASVPGGQVLLIPAVYDYVRSVLKEIERLHESTAA